MKLFVPVFYLECNTISKILLAISVHMAASDHDHAYLRDSFFIQRLTLYMANQGIKFQVSSFSHLRDIGGGLKM